MAPFGGAVDATGSALVALCLVVTMLTYLYAARRAAYVRRMLQDWRQVPAVIVANETHQTRRNQTVYAPVVEWSPEGTPVFTTLPDCRSSPRAVGEQVTLLRDPEDWRRSRLLDPSALYWQEVWPLVISGTMPLAILLAWSLL